MPKFWLKIWHLIAEHEYHRKATNMVGHDAYIRRLNMAVCDCGDTRPLGTVKLCD